jgi:hypothetical protein
MNSSDESKFLLRLEMRVITNDKERLRANVDSTLNRHAVRDIRSTGIRN